MVKQKRPTVQFIHKFVEKILEEIKDFDWLCVGLYPSVYRPIGEDSEMVNSRRCTEINNMNDLKVLPKCNLRDVFLCISIVTTTTTTTKARLYDRKVVLSFNTSFEVNEESYASLEKTILQVVIDHTFS
jgi:hypothetical protein